MQPDLRAVCEELLALLWLRSSWGSPYTAIAHVCNSTLMSCLLHGNASRPQFAVHEPKRGFLAPHQPVICRYWLRPPGGRLQTSLDQNDCPRQTPRKLSV